MNIVIANSQDWFVPSERLLALREPFVIGSKEELTESYLEELEPEYVFFPHWNWIVPTNIHTQFRCVVFHTAPLPYGRGGSPIQNLIMRGFESAPVSAIQMSDELDAGPIYCQRTISLGGTLTEIFGRINDKVNELMMEMILSNPEPIAQCGTPTTFKRIPEAQNHLPLDGTLETVYDRIRMLDHPSYPSAKIRHGDFILEFSEAVPGLKELKNMCRIRKC